MVEDATGELHFVIWIRAGRRGSLTVLAFSPGVGLGGLETVGGDGLGLFATPGSC